MKAVKLKPCPWDIKNGEVHDVEIKGYMCYDYTARKNITVWIARCSCGVQKEGTTERKAITVWNRRPE
jgi:hypothetical protein